MAQALTAPAPVRARGGRAGPSGAVRAGPGLGRRGAAGGCRAVAHRRPRATAAQQQFRAAGVAYLPAFLPPDDFRAVQRECTALRRCLKKENNTVAKKRLGTYIAEESAIYGIFAGPRVHGRLGKVLEGDYWVSEFPMEYRVYPVGSSMDWHLDECLYEEPQYELVYTVTNTSDALTEWREGGLRVGEWTEPNSLLIVRAESALHRVTPVRKGERSILKVVYTCSDAKLPAFERYAERSYGKKK